MANVLVSCARPDNEDAARSAAASADPPRSPRGMGRILPCFGVLGGAAEVNGKAPKDKEQYEGSGQEQNKT